MTMAHEQDRSVILVSPEPCPKEFLDAVSSPKTSASATLVPADGSALLRERVEQQSSLIAMLKQRNDETFREVHVQQCIYMRSQPWCALSASLDSLINGQPSIAD